MADVDRPRRVGLYARVSTANHNQDVEMQLVELRQVAAQRNWQIVDEYVDEGISGCQESRPALDRLLADARAGRLDVVVVWRFDRFARSTGHLLSALEEFRLLGVGFISIREQIDTSTPVGKVLFTLVAAISEFERTLIVERVRAGVAAAKSKGIHCGRPRRELDVRAAAALVEGGHALREVASMLELPRSTLRRRLKEAGFWTSRTVER